MRFLDHLKDQLTFYFLCSKTVFDKYRPLLNTAVDRFGFVAADDCILLSMALQDESLQNQFTAEPDVIPLPHFTDANPVLPAAAVTKIRAAWPDAPVTDIHALTEWAGPVFGSSLHHAQLRVKRHQHRQTV